MVQFSYDVGVNCLVVGHRRMDIPSISIINLFTLEIEVVERMDDDTFREYDLIIKFWILVGVMWICAVLAWKL